MDWQQLVLFAILGLGAGSLIAGVALGIVVSYRGSGIINLATGAIAMLAGYSYWSLRTGSYGVDVPTAPALVITALFLLGVGLLIEFAVYRPLRTAAPLAKLAASLGVLLVAQAAVSLAFGIGTKPQPPVLPGGTVTVFGSNVPIDRFILPGIVLAATLVLSLVYRLSRFGRLDARRLRERGCGDADGALSQSARAHEHAARDVRRRRARRPRGLDHATRPPGAPVGGRPGADCRAVRPIHVVLDRLPGRALDRHDRADPLLPPDEELVPDRQRRRHAGRLPAARVRADGDRDVRARHEPAEPR